MMPTIHGRRSEVGTGTCSREQTWGCKSEKRGTKIVANSLEEVETVLDVTEVKIGEELLQIGAEFLQF